MTVPPRLVAACAALLLGTTLAGCGGPDASGAPDDASTEDFCLTYAGLVFDAVETYRSELADGDPSLAGGEEVADLLHRWAEEMTAVGTPSGTSEGVRAGFEVIVEDAAAADPDDYEPDALLAMDLADLDDDLSTEELVQVNAFEEYRVGACREIYAARGWG